MTDKKKKYSQEELADMEMPEMNMPYMGMPMMGGMCPMMKGCPVMCPMMAMPGMNVPMPDMRDMYWYEEDDSDYSSDESDDELPYFWKPYKKKKHWTAPFFWPGAYPYPMYYKKYKK